MTGYPDEEMLKDLQAKARALPREIEPPSDAWSVIKAEIDKPRTSTHTSKSQTLHLWQRPAFLAAAALLLVVGSSLVTVNVVRSRNAETARVAAARAIARPSEPGPTTFAEFASAENDYISSVNQLSAVLESEKTTLSPETVAKLKKSLEVIDAAILEARRALAADPANKTIVDMLKTSYEQKLDLLKRTTEMGRA